MDSTRSTPSPSPSHDYVAALIDAGSVLSQLVAHMHAYRGPGVTAAPVPDVLAGVLEDVLTDVVARHGDEAIAAAARVVAETVAVIEQDVFIVPPPRVGARSKRRPRRRRRR